MDFEYCMRFMIGEVCWPIPALNDVGMKGAYWNRMKAVKGTYQEEIGKENQGPSSGIFRSSLLY